jgi:hypothetical protein
VVSFRERFLLCLNSFNEVNMKFYLKPILSVLALVVLLGYAGCGGGKSPAPNPIDVQFGKLSGTWKVGTTGNVTLDGPSKKSDYADFQLVISGTPGATEFDYTRTGGPALSPWPATGKWSFGNTPETDVIRDKGTNKQVDITYSVTDTNLELTFTYSGAGEPKRTDKVTGVWVFSLVKQ